MPVSNYFGGHGGQVMDNMTKEYGPDKGKRVFYATANKKGIKPAFGGDVAGYRGVQDPEQDPDSPMPTIPPRQPIQLSSYDAPSADTQGAVPSMPSMPGLMASNMAPPSPPPSSGPSSGPGPDPAGPMPEISPNTVLSTGEGPMPMDPQTAAAVSGSEENPPAPPRTGFGEGDSAKALQKALQEYTAIADKKVPWWQTAIGMALSGTRGRDIAPMLMRPRGLPQAERKVAVLERAAEEERKQQANASSELLKQQQVETSKVEKRTHEDTLITNAQTRKLRAETAQQQINEIKDNHIKKWVEDQIGKSRLPDAKYQKESDPRPDGWEFVKNPSEPGSGFAVPPYWSPMPKELAPLSPGYKADQPAPHSVIQKATEDYNKLQLELKKPAALGTSEFSTAYLIDPKFKNPDGTPNVEAARSQYNRDMSQRTREGRPPSAANDTRLDRSYQFNVGELNKLGKPIEDTASRIGRLQDTINQGNIQSDALIGPELLSVMAGGQGSGLRMNEAEIARIVGGRTQWADLQAKLSRWGTEASARSVTPEQEQQIKALVKTVADKLTAKQAALSRAHQRLIDSSDPVEHRKAVNDARQEFNAVDQGGLQMGGTKADPLGKQDPAQQQPESSALPPAAKSSLKAGVETTFRNGQVWTLGPDGKEKRIR